MYHLFENEATVYVKPDAIDMETRGNAFPYRHLNAGMNGVQVSVAYPQYTSHMWVMS